MSHSSNISLRSNNFYTGASLQRFKTVLASTYCAATDIAYILALLSLLERERCIQRYPSISIAAEYPTCAKALNVLENAKVHSVSIYLNNLLSTWQHPAAKLNF